VTLVGDEGVDHGTEAVSPDSEKSVTYFSNPTIVVAGSLATHLARQAGAWNGLSRLRNRLWGGGVRLPEQVAETAAAVGFTSVQISPFLGGTFRAILAQRPA
jgi:hypothetical protein